MFKRKQAYSFIEVMVVMMILGLTATIALTIYNPRDQANEDTAYTQLEQLKNAIIIHNAQHSDFVFQDENNDPSAGPLWWTLLPGISDPDLTDPWGAYYEHDYFKGAVYSTGPDMINDNGDGDDILVFYRPPSAEIVAREPEPNSTVNSQNPTIATTWRFGGGLTIEGAVIYVDKKAVAARPDVAEYGVLPDPTFVGAAFGSGAGSNYSTAAISFAAPNLSDGIHYAQVKIIDSQGNARRASWSFRVDTSPPKIYALNPIPDSSFEYRNPLVSCLYHDASGIDTKTAEFDLLKDGTTILGGPQDYTAMNATSNFTLSASGLSYRPDAVGLDEGVYTAIFRIQDGAGNPDPITDTTWQFTIKDETAPPIQIHQPVDESAITTSMDIDMDVTNGVQVAVVGTTERSKPGSKIKVDLVVDHVWDGGSEGVDQIDDLGATVTTLTTYSDAAGSFKFPRVTIKDVNSSLDDEPKNIIKVRATDEATPPNSSEADTTIYVFNETNRLKCTVNATPMTTQPNENIHFSVWADKGTTPYNYVWDFDDGFTREGSLMTANTTSSLVHTFATTGNFIVTCQMTDQRGLTATASQNIYVGTEATTPSLYLDAVPPEVFCGAPDGSTKFHIRIGGKYLGFWRLHVKSNDDSVGGYRWYYSSAADKMYYTTDVHDEPDPGGEILWQSASSNDFVVEWEGTDNFHDSPHSFFNNTERRFPSNKMTGAVNRTHFAYLEYIDALGELVETSCPVAVYSSIPSPKGIKITAVKQVTNSPELYDVNIDGTPDYTCSNVVDLVAFTPESTNPTHMWISNYPLELHNIVNPGQTEISTYVIQVPPDGEIFWNWTMTDGLDYSAVDGSSGWVPIDPTTEAANPIFDWPITAWPESDITQMFSGNSAMLNSFSQPWRYPTTVWEMQPRNGSNIWNTLGQPGMNLEHEGTKRIYAIFQDAHIFTSTQVESSDASAGVTSCEIFYDISGPTPSSTPTFSNVEVVDNGTGDYSVTATITVTAADLSNTGFGLEWGSGLLPDGLVVVQPEGQYARYYSYSGNVDVDFGPLDEVVKNSTLRASVTYEDNLGRPTTIAASDPLKSAEASISRFTWTLTGGGGYTFYRKSDRSHFLLINTQETSYGKVPPKVDLEGKPTIFDIDANDPKLEHWMNNGATLSSSTGSKTFEDQWVSDKSNIDPTHFPNENDRLGHLRARRPWYPWAVEQEATFVVDNLHHYYMIMLKGDVYVEYRVYKGLDSNPACRPSNVGSQVVPADYIISTPAFTEVARVDKVSRAKFNPARVNEAEMWLPGEDSEPANNDIFAYRDLHSSSSDAGPFPPDAAYNKLKCWDELTDLLIEASTSSSHYETYTYRGILMGRDGGTIDKCRYKVTSNSFSAKMGFVPVTDPEAPISTNRYDVTTKQDYHRMLVKAELVEQSAGGNGWGLQIQNTFIEDVALPGYGSLGLGEISGSKFCIRFSHYSNDFDGMTTGTVRPCVLLEFDGTGDRARVTTSGALVSWDGTLPATSDWFICYGTHDEVVNEGKGGMHDTRGDPLMHSADIDWSTVLDGEEGTVTAYVSYIDGQGNQLTAYTTTASIDSAPPTFLGTAAVTLWSNPGHGLHYSEGGSTFRRSTAPQRWTSQADFTADYSAVNDSGSLFREFVGTDPINPAACDNTGIFVAHPTTAAATFEGDASPTNGNVARWLPIGSSFHELFDWDTGNAIQGNNLCYFRFKDDSHNVAPAVSPPDHGMGAEPEYNAGLALDTYAPDKTHPGDLDAAPTITIVTNTPGTIGRNDLGFGVPIISDEFPIFQWTSSENVPGDETANSGLAGVNFAVDTAGNTTTPPQVYPPMVNLLPEYYTSYDFSVSNTIHSSCVALGQNGRKWFAAQAVDLVGHIGPKSDVEFIYDKSGPIIEPTDLDLRYKAYIAGSYTKSYDDKSDNGWTAEEFNWDENIMVGLGIEEIVFTCTRGEIALQGVQLRSSTTAPAVRWPTDGSLWNPDHGTDVYQWPDGGGIYGYGVDFGDHDNWCPDYDGYQNLFRWPEGSNSLWRVDRVFFTGGESWWKREYRLDDVQLLDGGSNVDTIRAEGNHTSYLNDSTSWQWTAPVPGSEPEANRIQVDWDAHDSGKYTYSRWEGEGRRITLRTGESFSMTGLSTQANRLVWQYKNRNRSVRKEYTNSVSQNITDWNTTESTINVPDNINVHSIRLYLDITHTWRGDLRIWLEDPDGNNGGAVWYDRGWSDDDLIGWFNDDLTTNDWNALRWHNNPPNSNYNANGNWKLRIYDHGSGDVGTLNEWKLVISGDLIGFSESSDYTVKLVGSGGWQTSWTNAGALPEEIVSNAIRFMLDWDDIQNCATDQPNPGEAAGVHPNDSMVKHEWEYAPTLLGADPVYQTTDLSFCVFEPPPGQMKFYLRAKDRVGNSGPAEYVFGCLADVKPPAGGMEAFADASVANNPVATGTAYDTSVISYRVQAVEDTSNIIQACYTIDTLGNAVDPEDGVGPTQTVAIGPYPPVDPECWIEFGPGGIGAAAVPEGDREIKLRIQDAGGSWSGIFYHHCYIDRTAPGITTLNAYANNQPLTTNPVPDDSVVDTTVISYRLQTNEDQSKIVAYDIEEGPWGTVSDPDGTGATSITPMDAPDPIVWIQDNSIAEGRREIRVIVQDLCGKWSNVRTHTCWVDRTAPSGTLTAFVGPSTSTATPIADGDGINTTTIAYRIEVNEDQTPIVAYCYTVGGAGTIVDPVDGVGATVTVPVGPLGPPDPTVWIDFSGADVWEGHREFRVKVQDNSGKWSSTMTHHCYIDRTPPSFADCDNIDDNYTPSAATIQINGTGVSFDGTALDNAAGSGIATVEYRFSASDTTARSANWTAGTSTWDHSWDPDGKPGAPYNADNANGGVSNQLQVRLTDNAGNVSTGPEWINVQQVYIDNQAPSTPSSVTAGDPDYSADDYFTGTKNEIHSMLQIDYQDGGGVELTLTGTSGSDTLNSGNSNIGVNGTKDWMKWNDSDSFGEIWVRERDLAGNTSGYHEIMFNDQVTISNPATPSLGSNDDPDTDGKDTNVAINYTITDVDGDQGFVVKLEYKFDGAGSWSTANETDNRAAPGPYTFNWNPTTDEITGEQSGDCIIRLRVRENENSASWDYSNQTGTFWLDCWRHDVGH